MALDSVVTWRLKRDLGAVDIQRLSHLHGIRVDSVDLHRFARRNTELQLLAVTQSFESFLNDYISEHPRLGA